MGQINKLFANIYNVLNHVPLLRKPFCE